MWQQLLIGSASVFGALGIQYMYLKQNNKISPEKVLIQVNGEDGKTLVDEHVPMETLVDVYKMVRDADCPVCLRSELFGPCVGDFVPAYKCWKNASEDQLKKGECFKELSLYFNCKLRYPHIYKEEEQGPDDLLSDDSKKDLPTQ